MTLLCAGTPPDHSAVTKSIKPRSTLVAAKRPDPAGEGDMVVVPTVTTAGAGKAVHKDAAFQIFAKRLAHAGARRMVVALAAELAGASQVKPGLKILANGAAP